MWDTCAGLGPPPLLALSCHLTATNHCQPTAALACPPHPPTHSLRDHFIAKCGGAGTPAFVRAQRCFAESLAAYSLVCYLLQIKDR